MKFDSLTKAKEIEFKAAKLIAAKTALAETNPSYNTSFESMSFGNPSHNLKDILIPEELAVIKKMVETMVQYKINALDRELEAL